LLATQISPQVANGGEIGIFALPSSESTMKSPPGKKRCNFLSPGVSRHDLGLATVFCCVYWVTDIQSSEATTAVVDVLSMQAGTVQYSATTVQEKQQLQ
jgi:hypothetical protein